jgi:hypothetical protein
MPLTAEQFARVWGADALVRLRSSHGAAPIPDDARAFLVQAGLPSLIRCRGGSFEAKITFCRLASGLSPILSMQTVGPPLPPEWSVYWILGDEFFSNGAAWWCIHQDSGHIDRIDIELEHPIRFANSSVAQFAAAALAAASWSERGGSEADELDRELTALDSASMGSDRNFWPAYLDCIRDEGPRPGAFQRGSRSEGERALQAGPW